MAFPPAGSGTRTSCAEDLPEEGPRQIASAQAAGESAKRIQRSYRAGLLHHPEVYDRSWTRRPSIIGAPVVSVSSAAPRLHEFRTETSLSEGAQHAMGAALVVDTTPPAISHTRQRRQTPRRRCPPRDHRSGTDQPHQMVPRRQRYAAFIGMCDRGAVPYGER